MVLSNRTWVLFVVIAVMGTVVACADTDGRDPFALWETYTHDNGVYTFRYLAPPWQLFAAAPGEDPDMQIIAVEPLSNNMDAVLETGSLQARYKAIVSLRQLTSAEAEADADAARLSELTDEPVSTAPFENTRGQAGVYLHAQLPDRSIRAVYFNVTERRAVVMQLAGRGSVTAADFTLLLEGLEPERGGE